jgi:iron complex outermembrane recepter protein
VWRYVDTLPAYSVPSYFVMDCRLAWRPRRHLEVAVVGRNLLDSAHREFGSDGYVESVATEVARSVYGQVTWRY